MGDGEIFFFLYRWVHSGADMGHHGHFNGGLDMKISLLPFIIHTVIVINPVGGVRGLLGFQNQRSFTQRMDGS